MHLVNPPFSVAKAVFEASCPKQSYAGRATECIPLDGIREPASIQVSNSVRGVDRSNARPGIGSRAAAGEGAAPPCRTPADDIAGQLQDAYNRGRRDGERVGYWKGRYDEQKSLNGQLRQKLDDQRQCFKAYKRAAKEEIETALYDLNNARNTSELRTWCDGIAMGRRLATAVPVADTPAPLVGSGAPASSAARVDQGRVDVAPKMSTNVFRGRRLGHATDRNKG